MTDPLILAPGSTFHGLRVHSLLGQGGMGQTYLASHPLLCTPCVLKLFSGDEFGSWLHMFSEAHLAARIVSPHVVPVFDAGYEGEQPFLLQHYVDGIDLGELIQFASACSWPLRTEALLHVLADTAKGLHAVHQAGVLHRDIKPANIFLRGDGTTSIGDFGIASDITRRHERWAQVQLAELNASGTPLFMAPEQWLCEKEDIRTDLYSLGASAHFMFSHRPPFQFDRAIDLRIAHLQTPYESPRSQDPALAYAYAIIERLLAKSKDDRLHNAREVSLAFRKLACVPDAVVRTSSNTANIGNFTLRCTQGDLSLAEADVIVCASNWRMHMEVGVANALRSRGGNVIQEEAQSFAPVRMGDVVWTSAGHLSAKHVAHAVAALAGAICIQRCTLRTLFGAEWRTARTIAFPALGTGVGDVPYELAAERMIQAIRTFAWFSPRYVREIEIVLYESHAYERFLSVLEGFDG